ncbi:uncharacterized protein LOC122082324 isoform X2 [Macadamia integrifolia]|uniref:uncharacterized protein LOC122082324 isoform X2 n=1 Tax=Macadamia integrifolia TaxID=60698 RepID=UPI001C4E8B2A|nr:uncharacterized protein LOC122082324 isoform X2 [Macadamia integrifolia]
MADESRVSRPLETGTSKDRGEGNELEEVETLEIQVKQTAQTIRHYRTTLPDQFKKTFAYVLAAQRPLLPNIGSTALPGIAGDGVTVTSVTSLFHGSSGSSNFLARSL